MAQQQHLEEARELLRTGRYEAALARLNGYEGWPSPQHERAILLRAEMLLKRDPVDALEILARSSDMLRGEETLFDYYLLSGVAYAGSRNFDGAAEMFALAYRAADNDSSRLASVAYHRARLRFMRGDFEPSDTDFALALTHPDPGLQALCSPGESVDARRSGQLSRSDHRFTRCHCACQRKSIAYGLSYGRTYDPLAFVRCT